MLYSPWVLWPLLVVTVFIMATTAYVGFHPKSGPAHRFEYRLRFLAMIYGLGCVLKFMVLGPDFVRWHLADVGFPAMIVAAYVALYGYWYKKIQPIEDYARAKRSLAEATVAQFAAPIAVLISCAYEFSAHAAQTSAQAGPVYVGRFDWVDIVCYVVGGLVVFFMARKHRLVMTDAFMKLAAAKARLEELEKAAAKAAARPRTKTANRKRPNHRKRR